MRAEANTSFHGAPTHLPQNKAAFSVVCLQSGRTDKQAEIAPRRFVVCFAVGLLGAVDTAPEYRQIRYLLTKNCL
jgi:hypothetical protein